jgi:hypothetical protein
VLWFGIERILSYYWDDFYLPSQQIFAFSLTKYNQAINQTIEREKALSLPIWNVRTTTDVLPELKPDELSSVLEPHFPQPDEAMYRYPERSDDLLGAKLLRKVRAILYVSRKHIAEPYRFVYEAELQNKFRKGEIGAVRVCEPPQMWTELRIGLELETGFDECIWRVGKTEQGVAVQFLANPYFPLWLCGEAIDQAFADEPFLQD